VRIETTKAIHCRFPKHFSDFVITNFSGKKAKKNLNGCFQKSYKNLYCFGHLYSQWTSVLCCRMSLLLWLQAQLYISTGSSQWSSSSQHGQRVSCSDRVWYPIVATGQPRTTITTALVLTITCLRRLQDRRPRCPSYSVCRVVLDQWSPRLRRRHLPPRQL